MQSIIMTIKELEKKLLTEKHIIGGLQVECGKKTEYPGVLGIFEDNGQFYVYDTNDRGGVVILDKGNEEEMTEALYRRVLKEEKRYLKRTT